MDNLHHLHRNDGELTVSECVGQLRGQTAMESFFRMLKQERVNLRFWQIRAEARADVFNCIVRFHNSRCQHRFNAAKQKQLLLAKQILHSNTSFQGNTTPHCKAKQGESLIGTQVI